MRIVIIALALGLATPATAEVVKAEPGGFEIATTVLIEAPPERVWIALVAPARWWSKDHTYSGDAKNLSLDPRPGGCFCEALPGGGVEHARIVFAQPGKTLRLRGALGPLQGEAVVGTLTFSLAPDPGGTRVRMTYVVGGHIRGGAVALASPVDGVLALQLAGLKAAATASR